MRRVWLRSDALELALLPELGGKLQTLRLRGSDHNVLLEPPEHPYLRAYAGAPFDAFDTSGWDECLPTVAACEHAGSRYSDHGELWSAAWVFSRCEDGSAWTHAVVEERPWSFSRRLTLKGPTLRLDYEVHSKSEEPHDVAWSAHPLLAVSEGARIELPAGTREGRVEWSFGDRLGPKAARVSWPLHGGERLDVLRGPAAHTADKLFFGPVEEGRCALHDEASGVTTELRFDPSLTPYLGVWICQGGWPAEPKRARRHFTVALEPCSAPHDSLAEAALNRTAWRLEPGKSKAWWVEVTLHSG